jgi:dolichol-phosphate mannosyltransferase
MVAAVEREIPHAHILILDDNSPDGTGRLADELAETRPHLLVLHRPAKEGLGPAYEEGMRLATKMDASVIVQMDADLSHDPAAISGLIAPILEGADLVLGSRYMPGGRVVDWGKTRLAISRCGNLVARSMLGLGLSDLTGGFKAWRAGLLEEIDLEAIEATGYGFQIEMTWRAHGCGARIVEVPITFRERRLGRSKMSMGIAAEAIQVLVQLRRERRSGARVTLRGNRESRPAKAGAAVGVRSR